MPEPGRQRVVGLIGCPGAGKTTYARRFDPLEGWVHLTLDSSVGRSGRRTGRSTGPCAAAAGTTRPGGSSME